MSQLPLALRRDSGADFDSYWAEVDALVVQRLRGFAEQPGATRILLTGAADSGKTHLALAVCEAARAAGHSVVYLPLQRVDASLVAASTGHDLVVIDAIEAVRGQPALAEALFTLLNHQHDRQRAVLICGREAPSPEDILPDLASRISQAELLRLNEHGDAARRSILLQHAERAGIPLDPAAADYLLRHCERRLSTLLATLAQLDRESLARGRRITVALLRECLRGVVEDQSNSLG